MLKHALRGAASGTLHVFEVFPGLAAVAERGEVGGSFGVIEGGGVGFAFEVLGTLEGFEGEGEEDGGGHEIRGGDDEEAGAEAADGVPDQLHGEDSAEGTADEQEAAAAIGGAAQFGDLADAIGVEVIAGGVGEGEIILDEGWFGEVIVDEGFVGWGDGGRVVRAGIVHGLTVAELGRGGYKRRGVRGEGRRGECRATEEEADYGNCGSCEACVGEADWEDSQRGLYFDGDVGGPSRGDAGELGAAGVV